MARHRDDGGLSFVAQSLLRCLNSKTHQTGPFLTWGLGWGWQFLAVNLTTSVMNYSPEMEGVPVIPIWRLEDMGF